MFIIAPRIVLGEVGERPEARPEEVPPHQRRDDAGHGVGDEDRESHEALAAHATAVECEGEEEGEPEHDRHLDHQEQHHAPEAREELGVGQCLEVVVEADEDGAADEPGLEEAQVARVTEWDHEHCGENHEERDEKQPRGARLGSAEPAASPAVCPDRRHRELLRWCRVAGLGAPATLQSERTTEP
jgi:hypothetical protein